MQFRNLMKDNLAVTTLPTGVNDSKASRMLAEKLAIQIGWMRRKGIDILLKESECPRLVQKPPLPGTIIYFSTAIERR